MTAAVLDAFWAYEAALMADDLGALDRFFEAVPATTRGDEGGLLRGHGTISAFRSVRGGAPHRSIVSVDVRPAGDEHALVTAVTAPDTGGHGLQTQLWHRRAGVWVIAAAHVTAPPRSFDSRVWRVVGDPLVPGGPGPLAGEMLALKDLFDVAGHRVGAGVPAYLDASPVASAHAVAVGRLLAAGAGIRGIARTDQFAYSLAGDNDWYGTPPNAVVAGALPGGSSSGSATAVALGAASIGLGTDTAGSIRVPASYQGLWGLRTTHGSVPATGLLGLAPDFDAIGLLARSGELLGRAAEALLVGVPDVEPLPGLVVCTALLDGLPEDVRSAFDSWLIGVAHVAEVELPPAPAIPEAFRLHQGFQAWQLHGQWVTEHPGALKGAAAQRFSAAATITEGQNAAAVNQLDEFRTAMESVLGDRVLVLPSAASTAPHVWETAETVDRLRVATLRLTCLAPVLGRPAASVPLLTVDGAPVGVSLVGPHGSDLALIGLGRQLAAQRGRWVGRVGLEPTTDGL